MDNAYVLDSFAILAHLEDETSGEKVTKMLNKAQTGEITLFMSLINLGEVYYITARERGSEKAEEILMLIEQLPVKILDVDKNLTLGAARLKAKYSISYADCFASALAISKNIRLVTGDPEFKKLEKEVRVVWI